MRRCGFCRRGGWRYGVLRRASQIRLRLRRWQRARSVDWRWFLTTTGGAQPQQAGKKVSRLQHLADAVHGACRTDASSARWRRGAASVAIGQIGRIDSHCVSAQLPQLWQLRRHQRRHQMPVTPMLAPTRETSAETCRPEREAVDSRLGASSTSSNPPAKSAPPPMRVAVPALAR